MKKVWRWIVVVMWAALIWYLTTLPDFHPSNNSLLSTLLSNGGHFFFFGVMALLLPLTSGASMSATVLYGFATELTQRTIPGRTFSLFDLGLDALGAFVFTYSMRKYTK